MNNITINATEHVPVAASKHGTEVEFLRALITDFLSKDIGGQPDQPITVERLQLADECLGKIEGCDRLTSGGPTLLERLIVARGIWATGPQSTSTDHAVGELDQEIAKLREEG